jgi:hypothetical protein
MVFTAIVGGIVMSAPQPSHNPTDPSPSTTAQFYMFLSVMSQSRVTQQQRVWRCLLLPGAKWSSRHPAGRSVVHLRCPRSCRCSSDCAELNLFHVCSGSSRSAAAGLHIAAFQGYET